MKIISFLTAILFVGWCYPLAELLIDGALMPANQVTWIKIAVYFVILIEFIRLIWISPNFKWFLVHFLLACIVSIV
jgi:hypothetical protein